MTTPLWYSLEVSLYIEFGGFPELDSSYSTLPIHIQAAACCIVELIGRAEGELVSIQVR